MKDSLNAKWRELGFGQRFTLIAGTLAVFAFSLLLVPLVAGLSMAGCAARYQSTYRGMTGLSARRRAADPEGGPGRTSAQGPDRADPRHR